MGNDIFASNVYCKHDVMKLIVVFSSRSFVVVLKPHSLMAQGELILKESAGNLTEGVVIGGILSAPVA